MVDPKQPSRRGNLVIASNRLPVSLTLDGDSFSFKVSSGGLAAALQGVAEDDPFVWVGWPGCPVPEEMERPVSEAMAHDDLVPVFVSEREEELYYHGISNQVLWPLFHYFTTMVDFQEEAWEEYCKVNERFAEQILRIAEPGARVWIHDFHLMLVPGLLRQARPDLEIGFFLHIPFPSSEIYRLFPARAELLRGVLGADYIGFHTHDYARHFRSTCLRTLGLESDHESIPFDGRRVGVGVHPIGIDVNGFERALRDPKTSDELSTLRERYGNRKIILGVERLDYTKGIELKLQAFERLLEKRPDLHGEVVLLQIIVPSRLANSDYAALKSSIEETVGRLNGRHGGPGYTPVEYLHRSVPKEQLVALYRFANVGFVAPVRDGMNLVAQEFVLCQEEHGDLPDAFRGILVLSEFAGAAQVLPRAPLVNPWNIEQMVETLEEALDMSSVERRARMQPMVDQVRHIECKAWARKFLERQGHAAMLSQDLERQTTPLRDREEERFREAAASADRCILFLDYDGTLREIAPTPEEAAPTPEIIELIEDLSAIEGNEVHIVSGRHRDDLEGWFGHLPVCLSAEHGLVFKTPGAGWSMIADVELDFLGATEDILRDVCEDVPGTRIEHKPGAIAWHYRQLDLDYGMWRARELHSQLEQDLSHLPVDIIHGHRVIEVRAFGVNKGGYVKRVLESAPESAFVAAFGDDRTDRDMYEVLPGDAYAIHVGRGIDEANHSLATPHRVREVLRSLATARSSTQKS